jgi:short-subunit dehydrogenase
MLAKLSPIGCVMIDFARGCAVITGGSSGIGRALALALADRGMAMVIVGRTPQRADAVAAEARDKGARAMAVPCDVGDRNDVVELAKTVRDEFGCVELLALNAGVTTAGPLVEHIPADWDWVFGSVLLGVVHGIQAFLADMVAAGHGHVLITGSMVGLVPDYFINHGPYASAKSGVIGLGVALRPELDQSGVGLSVLIPAGVETGLPDSHVGRPAITSGAMTVATAPHPLATVLPDKNAPALTREFRFLPADQAARRTVDGIQRDELFIITHPEFRPVFEDYSARILRAFDDSLAWEQGQG